jgi:hypothetical protein
MFFSEYEIDGTVFKVRGLTVGEVAELSLDKGLRTKISLKQSFFQQVAVMCIKGWSNVLDEDGGEVAFKAEYVDNLPADVLEEIGVFIYKELSFLSDIEQEKLKGYIRFAYYLNDQPDAVGKTFSCLECVRANRDRNRNCGLLEEEKEEIRDLLDTKPEETVVENRKATKKLVKSVVSKKQVSEDRQVARGTVNIGGHNFPECPISWVDDYLRTIGEQAFYCYHNKMSYFSGGVSDQLNKIFQIVKTVGSEASAIDAEKMEAANKKK